VRAYRGKLRRLPPDPGGPTLQSVSAALEAAQRRVEVLQQEDSQDPRSLIDSRFDQIYRHTTLS
jgi:hypothetical protein